jgi:uncharacterized protein YbcI
MSARNEDQRRSIEISNAVVRVFREYLGRGPTKARTLISEDMITVVCRDTMTKAEQRLHERGEIDTVRHIRRKYQDAMRDDLIAVVEELTGRRVIAFLSDNHMDPDIAVETFVTEGGAG